MNKKVFRNLLLICMAAIMLLACGLNVWATEVEGDSESGGSATQSGSGSFGTYYEKSADALVGWRFAGYDTLAKEISDQ